VSTVLMEILTDDYNAAHTGSGKKKKKTSTDV